MPAVSLAAAVGTVLTSGVVSALVLTTGSDSTIVLRHPSRVSVTTRGTTVAGRDGEVLLPGAVVTVAAGGSAEVTTGPRRLLLGGKSLAGPTVVKVSAPELDEIRQGSVVASDPSGRSWTLQAGPVSATGLRGVIRIDRTDLVQIGAYSGQATLSTASGATVALTGLRQADPAGASLPAAAAPLQLRDDALDMLAAPALVTLDQQLQGLAREIDADPFVAAAFKTAPFVAAAFKTASGRDPSEVILARAIAAAGTTGIQSQRLQTAESLRAAGGSWGVVSSLLGARLAPVQTSLTSTLNSFGASPVAAAAAPGLAPTTAVRGPSAQPSTAAATTTTASAPSSAPPATQTARNATVHSGMPSLPVGVPSIPAVTPSSVAAVPSPSASVSPGLLETLLKTVTSLLPSPKAAPQGDSPVKASAAPSTAPTPAATPLAGLGQTLTGTLGSVLGH